MALPCMIVRVGTAGRIGRHLRTPPFLTGRRRAEFPNRPARPRRRIIGRPSRSHRTREDRLMRFWLPPLLCLAAAALVPAGAPDKQAMTDTQSLVKDGNQFAVDLYGRLA